MSNNNLNKLVMEPLSDADINRYLPGIKILNYEQLGEYKTIEELLPKKRDAIILFVQLTTHNSGHWQCLTRSDNNIFFFDSYSVRPDKALTWVSKYMRKECNIEIPYVSYLLNSALKDGFKVSFNAIDYQDKKNTSIATCGRWCVQWVKWNLYQVDNSPKAFYKFMKKYSKDHELNYDLAICKLIP